MKLFLIMAFVSAVMHMPVKADSYHFSSEEHGDNSKIFVISVNSHNGLIAYVERKLQRKRAIWHIGIIEASTGNQQRHKAPGTVLWPGGLSWHTTGSHILCGGLMAAHQRASSSVQNGIWQLSLPAGNWSNVMTNTETIWQSPRLSPDGKQVLVYSFLQGKPYVYGLSEQSIPKPLLSEGKSGHLGFEWLSNSHVVLAYNFPDEHRGYRIGLVNVNDMTVDHFITGANAGAISVSRDGRWLAWSKADTLNMASIQERGKLHRVPIGGDARWMRWSPAGNLAIATSNQEIVVCFVDSSGEIALKEKWPGRNADWLDNHTVAYINRVGSEIRVRNIQTQADALLLRGSGAATGMTTGEGKPRLPPPEHGEK